MKFTTAFEIELLLAGVIWTAACRFDHNNEIVDDGGTGKLDASAESDADVIPTFGFSNSYEVFSVPDAESAGGFFTANISVGGQNWFLVDIDGDGSREIVQTTKPGATPFSAWSDGSNQYWKVFRIEKTGFQSLPDELGLPLGPTGRGFYTLQASGVAAWNVADIDGDGNLDIVQLTDPQTGELFASDGIVSWSVFKGTGTSFETSQQWQVPDLGNGPFKSIQACGAVGCWKLLDLNNDNKLDLVHSSDASVLSAWDSPGNPNWHVYVGTATGFAATFVEWPLPTNEDDRGFYGPDSAPYWATRDLDSDGSLDLVQTRPYPVGSEPFSNGSQPFWKAYKLTPSGFETSSETWLLPTGSVPFNALEEAEDNLYWSTFDIDGDGKQDLVHTANTTAATPSTWGAQIRINGKYT